MTFNQYIKSYKHCVEDNIKIINRYRKLFKNYLSVIYMVKKNNYPIDCDLRSGEKIIINRHFEIMNLVLAKQYRISYDKDNDIMFGFKKSSEKEIKLYGGEGAGDAAIFLEGHYDSLPVNGKTVIDLGANIGDSAIYFTSRGAKKVVGIEPHPKNYEIAKKNIDINQLSNKIHLIHAGCSSESRMMTINPNTESGIRARLDESKEGMKIPIITLKEILNDIGGETAVLKIDCEGCEYEVILKASKSLLQKFCNIIIEYHYGYKNLKKKLEDCGFQVTVTEPRYTLDTKMYIGFLYA